jgi:hypothetical protein
MAMVTEPRKRALQRRLPSPAQIKRTIKAVREAGIEPNSVRVSLDSIEVSRITSNPEPPATPQAPDGDPWGLPDDD